MSAEREALAAEIAACRRCPGLNVKGVTGSAPGYGDENSPVMVVGQSLCHASMVAGSPFTGWAGQFLDAALDRAGRVKADLFLTNVVHCHPPDDRRPKWQEMEHCVEYLLREWDLVQPRLIIGLGGDAHDVLTPRGRTMPVLAWNPFTPPAPSADGPALLCLPHPSCVKFWPAAEQEQWIDDLAAAIRWGFRGR